MQVYEGLRKSTKQQHFNAAFVCVRMEVLKSLNHDIGRRVTTDQKQTYDCFKSKSFHNTLTYLCANFISAFIIN